MNKKVKLSKWVKGRSENGYGDEGILLRTEDSENRILSVVKTDSGKIKFAEECDCYFHREYSKQEALEVIEELKNYIIND